MRRIEEKKAIWLEIIALVLLVSSTALLQVADSHISNFNNSLLFEMTSASMNVQNAIFQKMTAEFAGFKQFVPFETYKAEVREENKERIVSIFGTLMGQDADVRALHQKLENNEIDLREYFSQSVKLSEKIAAKEINTFNGKMRSIRKQITDGTKWTIVKNVLLVLQFILIAFLAYGYIDILRSISRRDKKKNREIPKQQIVSPAEPKS